MSRNVERARAAFEAFNREGPESFYGLLDPSIEWVADRADAGRVTVHGVDAVRRLFSEQFEGVEEMRFDVDEMREAGSRVLAIGHLRGRFRTTGIEGAIPLGVVLDITPDGHLLRYESFLDPGQAFESMGLTNGDVAG